MAEYNSMSSHHSTRYGQWAGSPNGSATNKNGCAEQVWPKGQWHSSQCARKRGHGPEEAFCKQHAKRFESKK